MSLKTLAFLLLVGCATETQPAPAQPTPSAVATEEAPAPTSVAAVHHVVFVGQAEACDCTKARVAASWDALQEVVAAHPLPVERLDVDGDAERVEDLRSMEGFVATPALYFLTEEGDLVQMLQGELSAEMIREITG